jgi:hypothetical protein
MLKILRDTEKESGILASQELQIFEEWATCLLMVVVMEVVVVVGVCVIHSAFT